MNTFHFLGYPWFERSPRGEAIRSAKAETKRLTLKSASGTNGCKKARLSLKDARHAQLSAEMGVAL